MQTKLAESKTYSIVCTAMMMCLIMVAIFVLRIPIPFTQGYVNLSDGIIFLGIMLIGKKNSVVAASLGSMLGDIIGGFAMWAPWTFFIKGGMAAIAGLIMHLLIRDTMKDRTQWIIRIAAMFCGGLFMVAGYFVAEKVMYGSWAVAALGIPWNIGQFALGIVLASVIIMALQKTGLAGRKGSDMECE